MLFMPRMAAVTNSLAALYSVRQTSARVPPEMHDDFVNLLLFLNQCEHHLKRKVIFVGF